MEKHKTDRLRLILEQIIMVLVPAYERAGNKFTGTELERSIWFAYDTKNLKDLTSYRIALQQEVSKGGKNEMQ